jgi:hypothetical protein
MVVGLWCLAFNNISLYYIGGGNGVPGENHIPAASHWQTL